MTSLHSLLKASLLLSGFSFFPVQSQSHSDVDTRRLSGHHENRLTISVQENQRFEVERHQRGPSQEHRIEHRQESVQHPRYRNPERNDRYERHNRHEGLPHPAHRYSRPDYQVGRDRRYDRPTWQHRQYWGDQHAPSYHPGLHVSGGNWRFSYYPDARDWNRPHWGTVLRSYPVSWYTHERVSLLHEVFERPWNDRRHDVHDWQYSSSRYPTYVREHGYELQVRLDSGAIIYVLVDRHYRQGTRIKLR